MMFSGFVECIKMTNNKNHQTTKNLSSEILKVFRIKDCLFER